MQAWINFPPNNQRKSSSAHGALIKALILLAEPCLRPAFARRPPHPSAPGSRGHGLAYASQREPPGRLATSAANVPGSFARSTPAADTAGAEWRCCMVLVNCSHAIGRAAAEADDVKREANVEAALRDRWGVTHHNLRTDKAEVESSLSKRRAPWVPRKRRSGASRT